MQTDKWKTLFFGLSTVISIAFGVMMLREQDDINHRLDVRDAKEWKRLVEGNKSRDAERMAMVRNLERIIAICSKRSDGCGLPTN